jgi:hypothetical protein
MKLVLNKESIKDANAWGQAAIELPKFDYEKMSAPTINYGKSYMGTLWSRKYF